MYSPEIVKQLGKQNMAAERIFVGRQKELEQFKKIVGWASAHQSCLVVGQGKRHQ